MKRLLLISAISMLASPSIAGNLNSFSTEPQLRTPEVWLECVPFQAASPEVIRQLHGAGLCDSHPERDEQSYRVVPQEPDDNDNDCDRPGRDKPKKDRPRKDRPERDKPKNNRGHGNGDEGDCRGGECRDPDNPGRRR